MDDEPQENNYTVTCASCGKETLNVKELYSAIPRFGRVVVISMLCSNCGYRVFDILSLEDRGPSKIEFKVNDLKDLSARVIRSSSSTLTIPELGLELKPGDKSEGFITNIEGVLVRFLAFAEQLYQSVEPEEKEGAMAAIEKIKLAMEGNVPFTVIIEDEYGNSAILPPEEDSLPP
jgi:zinc finger protein